MRIHGNFINKRGNKIYVTVIMDNGSSEDVDINASASIRFSDDPIHISYKTEDLFQPIIQSSCAINFVTKEFLATRFFSTNMYDSKVLIGTSEGSGDIWSGFVEPSSYNQGYAQLWDEYTLNCIDYFSTLSYFKYDDIDSTSYDRRKENVAIRSVYDIMHDMLPYTVVYDKSKSVRGSNDNIFKSTSVSESVFLDDSFDDIWNKQEVLEELLRYFNLHIIQLGTTMYLFDWDSKRKGTSITTEYLSGNTSGSIDTSNITITQDMYCDDSTNMSVADVYNQIVINCDIKDVETIIESPFDSSYTSSPFDNKIKYMKEIWAYGNGHTAHDNFWKLLNNQSIDWEDAGTRDWYIQMKQNSNWQFNLTESSWPTMTSTQYSPLKQMKSNLYKYETVLMSYGKSKIADPKDNSPESKINMTDSIVIGINGISNEMVIQNSMPIARYSSAKAVNLSPADDNTTNYLVFSGSLTLVPIVNTSDGKTWYQMTSGGKDALYHKTVPSEKNKDGMYYCTKFESGGNDRSWVPFTDNAVKKVQYVKNSTFDKIDIVSKVDILECMLKIGDKYCVETFVDGKSVYGWYDEAHLPYVDGQKRNTFAIGIDPKIDDYIIGQKHNIANNIIDSMNIGDFEGTAIPIKKSDNLSGDILFQILGPVNSTFEENTKHNHREWIFFKCQKGNDTIYPILNYTSSIMLDDFECSITTDNALRANMGDNDLVYMSEMNDKYLTPKQLDFKLQTPLTSEECNEKGIKNTINLSSMLKSDGSALNSIISNGVEAKAEELYIDQYYKTYFKPRLVFDTSLHNTFESHPFWHLFTDDSNDIQYMPYAFEYNPMDDTYSFTMIDNLSKNVDSPDRPIVIYPNKFVSSVSNLVATVATDKNFTQNVETLYFDDTAEYQLQQYIEKVNTYNIFLKYKCDVMLEDGTQLKDYELFKDPINTNN